MDSVEHNRDEQRARIRRTVLVLAAVAVALFAWTLVRGLA
jgi:hypothetical protein